MTKEKFQSLVFDLATDAKNYVDEAVSAARAKATEYYKGNLPDVDKDAAEEDRSTATLTEVRDTVLGMMPDLLRIFFGSDSVVEYRPTPDADLDMFAQRELEAQQATDYVQNVVLAEDNPDSFITFYDTFQDALVRKTGFIKWWWEKSKKPKYSTHTGLTQDQVLAIVEDPDVEIVGKTTTFYDNPEGGVSLLYDVQIKRVCDYGKARIASVPCENIIVSRGASTIGTATLFGYHEDKTHGDFIDMGFDAADLADADRDPDDTENEEKQAREPENTVPGDDQPVQDPSQKKIKYGELYIQADFDGDGIAELRRVITAGTRWKVLENEPWGDVQFADFCPYREAHTFFGESVADMTMDVMRIKSRILRDVLDSLAQSVTPQTAVVDGQVNLDDILNPDTSKVIRQRAPGMVQPFVVPFVGQDAFPVLDFMTRVREGRTGMSDASQGLDPKTLQSTDKDAVHATLSRAQSRIEMVARCFAETGMTRLFRGILKLVHENQDVARVVELRGRPVMVNPKSWNVDMHVRVNIPLGRGSQQEQVMFLTSVASKQEQLLETLGPKNLFVKPEQLRYTYGKILEIAGWRNTESFFIDPSKLQPQEREEIEAAMQQAMAAKSGAGAAGPAAPDPQVEMAKIASNEKIKLAELQQKRDEMIAEAQIATTKLQADTEMRALEIWANRQTTLDKAQLDAAVKSAGDRIKANTAILVEQLKPRGGADKGEANADSQD